jgi:hypothetical protein
LGIAETLDIQVGWALPTSLKELAVACSLLPNLIGVNDFFSPQFFNFLSIFTQYIHL